MVSQDRWSQGDSSIALKYGTFWQDLVILQDRWFSLQWSLKTGFSVLISENNPSRHVVLLTFCSSVKKSGVCSQYHLCVCWLMLFVSFWDWSGELRITVRLLQLFFPWLNLKLHKHFKACVGCVRLLCCILPVLSTVPCWLFQKAIQEVGPEWAQNKKLVDLSSKTVQQAVSINKHQKYL